MKLMVFKKNKGMAMIIVMTAAFVVLVTIGFTVALITGSFEKNVSGNNRERALINAHNGLERARGIGAANSSAFDSCSGGDCLDLVNGGCGPCSATYYQNGDDIYKVRLESITAPDRHGPTVGSASFLSFGSYKNIGQQRSGSVCLNYCSVAGYNCGDNGCGGSCGLCPEAYTCTNGVCTGQATSCSDITIECDINCAMGDTCGGGTVVDPDQNIVAIAPGCQDTNGGGCDIGGTDGLSSAWDNSGDPIETGATDHSDGRNNIQVLDPQNHPEYEAANFCDQMVINNGVSFDQWYLPAYDELVKIQEASGLGLIPGIAAGCYWSSTEKDGASALSLNITNILACSDPDVKNTTNYIRCTRRY